MRGVPQRVRGRRRHPTGALSDVRSLGARSLCEKARGGGGEGGHALPGLFFAASAMLRATFISAEEPEGSQAAVHWGRAAVTFGIDARDARDARCVVGTCCEPEAVCVASGVIVEEQARTRAASKKPLATWEAGLLLLATPRSASSRDLEVLGDVRYLGMRGPRHDWPTKDVPLSVVSFTASSSHDRRLNLAVLRSFAAPAARHDHANSSQPFVEYNEQAMKRN